MSTGSAGPADVLVTGAGRGLGRGVAMAFAEAGWRLWLVSEVPDELDRTGTMIQEIGGRAVPIVADLAAPTGCARVIDAVSNGADRLRAVVNNAGVLHRVPVEAMPTDVWALTLAVNLTAPMLLTRGLLPRLDGGGSVINVSSRAGVTPFADEAAYCASKFGLEAFTQSLALELEGRPISVNTITPGCRIKPTSVTEREAELVPSAERDSWRDPRTLGPAFIFLAGLSGEVSGRRFNAATLTEALERGGPDATMEGIETLYE